MRLKIGKYTWTIEWVDNLFNSFGCTTFNELTIKISKNQCDALLKDTIFHELIHAYIKSYGFNREYFYEEDVVLFITQNIDSIMLLTDKVWKEMVIAERKNKNETK